AGQHPEEVAPAGSTGGGTQGEEVVGIRENGGEEEETKDKKERAKPEGERSAGAEEEGEGEGEVADDVKDEDLTHKRGAVGLPAGGDIEEVEIGGGSDDADLEEIEDVEPIDAGRFTAGAREKHHDDGSRP